MKKAIRPLLLISLALLFCTLILAGCGDDEATPSTQPTSSSTSKPAVGTHTHTFSQWTTAKDATCTEDGLEERVCDCGEKQEQPIPSPGHIPGEWATESEPTATMTGSRRQYCLVCNALLQEEVIPATGTTGLSYQVNEADKTCTIMGIGTCSDSTIVIPSTIDGYTVTGINAWAFELCTSLQSITIPNSVITIGSGAFSECTSLTSVTLSNSITRISSNTFSGCTRLKSIVLPDSVTVIDYSAFDDCTALTDINIPNGVTYIGTIAFAGCTALNNISFPDSVTYVGENVLKDSGYYKNESNWENDVLYAGNHVVAAKQTISGACTIKAGTRTVCSSAFKNCTALTGITIPDGVITIAGNAFYGCTGLTGISFPDSITHIERDVLFGTAYYNDGTNWDNGVLYAGNHVVATMEELSGSCVLRPGTRTICDWAFSGRSELTAIDIPDGVTHIGRWAFADCSGLTTLNIPNSVTYIAEGAFRLCTNLTNVTIGNGITRLAYETFFRCYDLVNIHFAGTKEQWEAIVKESDWNKSTGNYVIHCTDGDIQK